MKISPISAFNIYKTTPQNRIRYKNNLTCDTVSFSAKSKRTNNNLENQNIATSVKLGEKLYTELISGSTKKDITKLVQQELQTLQVSSLKNIKNQVAFADGYAAYFTSEIADDFSMDKSAIYLNEKPFRIGDKNEKLSFALDVAHEYTHAQQVVSGQEAEFYKRISNGDVTLARTIVALSNLTYELMDKAMQTKTLPNVFANPIDFINFQRYHREIPREMYLSKQMLVANAKCKNEMEYKKHIEYEFQNAFINTLQYIFEHPERVETSILNKLIEIGEKNQIDDLFEKTKQMCAHNAQSEAEARTTESIIAKNILGTKKTLNIDCYPMYYELISKSLK